VPTSVDVQPYSHGGNGNRSLFESEAASADVAERSGTD
jgi:hypothetical protein